MDHEEANQAIADEHAAHHAGLFGNLLSVILQHRGVSDATTKAVAAGVPWAQIIAAVLPFVMQLFTGGKVDWQAVIAAILSLIVPPTPAPVRP